MPRVGKVYVDLDRGAWAVRQDGVLVGLYGSQEAAVTVARQVAGPHGEVVLAERQGAFVEAATDEPISEAIARRRTEAMPRDGTRDHLKSMKADGVGAVVVVTAQDEQVCAECRALEGKTFAIGSAIWALPVPGRCTATSGCRCSYVAAPG